MSEEAVNRSCPFCGGTVDPSGWMAYSGPYRAENTEPPETGPECEQCGATTPSLEVWNRRTDLNWAATHRHIEGGLYRREGPIKVRVGRDWQTCIKYTNVEGEEFACSSERWQARFIDLAWESRLDD